jgi:predicted TIM-barrel fold metal-dependent hydrolase
LNPAPIYDAVTVGVAHEPTTSTKGISMAYPDGVGAIDLMIGFPFRDKKAVYEYLQAGIKDKGSDDLAMPAGYMFKDVPGEAAEDVDPIDFTFGEMDRWGVAAGLFGLSDQSREAKQRHPGRVYFSLEVDPNDITGTVRAIRKAHEEDGLTAVTTFPAGCMPQVPVSDRRYYAIYQTCIDLDIPIIANAGIPGPRFPADCQHVMHFDQVCYDFPELRIVMRHGAEPWEELAVKLMLKWPGLHYMPSAFAPKYYPEAIVKYANSRGADKIMYAGYFPAGLTLERIFTEMRDVPLKDDVWPKFLRENAKRVFKMDGVV